MEIDIIRRVISEMKFKMERETPNTRLDVENYIVIVESLEKQIPKQVIDVNGDYEPDYDCPTCGIRTRFEHQNYCLECGQKLGW